ncbi:unnamed protein product [Peronospora effusa]|uniref:Uncharacterized protein n=1 Tax=Peronospora effusa TaxID=542832 RepID=A0A3M6VC94_9STRA|nr:hypothetical protein DD238_008250 [Peronospora effusa]RQM12933.1 hypothetical protein DD237_005468 [Peronospora effusa]CAI5729628.1 unnamed protein product [Peronospora effusa]
MNLERWNFFMQTFDETGRYNFEDKLKETLKAFCGNDDRATLFLKRLVILRGRTRRNQLKWLREMKDPKQVYKDMKVDDKENRFNEDNLANWSKYVDAYNDLYLQSKETLRSYFSGLDEALIEKILRGRKNYPQMGPKKQMLDEILESWAAKKPPISPAEVFDHFEKALKKGKELSTVEEGKELSTVEEGKELSTVREGKELSTVEKGKELSTVEEGKELSTVEEGELISTVPLRGLKNYLEILNVGKQMGEKSQDEVKMEELLDSLLKFKSRRKESDTIEEFYKFKDALWPKNPLKRKSESPSDDARDRQRPRGE